MPAIVTSPVLPPIPTRDNDWCAYFDGTEEDGKYGWGATKLAAIVDLWQFAETPEEMLSVIVEAMRADLADMQAATAAPAAHANIMRIAYERAISTVEGIQ